jgi:hypothetical protein
MQLVIDNDPKHAAKTKALRVEWAASAMYVQFTKMRVPVRVANVHREPLNELGTIVAFDADFQPVLD